MLESILILLGLSIGSFLNVCIFRIPRGISVITQRSFCTTCNRHLRWFELIPVFSFIIQSGKCRICKSKISFRYPFVELISSLIFLLFYYKFGLSITYAEYVIYFLVALVVAFIDWEYLIIPNNVLLAGFTILLSLKLYEDTSIVVEQLMAGFVSFIIVSMVLVLGNYFLKKESMGMGDVKLSGFIGFVIGLPLFLISLWVSSIVGAVYGLYKKAKQKEEMKIPFGAILIVTSAIVLFFRYQIEELLTLWIN